MITLGEFREAVGARIDESLSGFGGQPATYSTLSKTHEYEELPRHHFYWTLEPEYERVVDVVTIKDTNESTGYSQEVIPHDLTLQIKVSAAELTEAEDMMLAVLEGFGRAPCIEGIGLTYNGLSSAADEFDLGVYDRTLEYKAWIGLLGRAETNPLIKEIDVEMAIRDTIEIEEEEETDYSDYVTITEV